ncbi:formyltransferase family protein [Mucilaginibacter paludis]|nr:formyltransferase family protein [Mucilaginibacter paludis]
MAYTLAMQQLQVHIFLSPAKDAFVQQKVKAFVQQTKLPFTEERNADKDLYTWLQKGNYDIGFILVYPHLIRLERLKNHPARLFNIHFGVLPGFKGPVPVFWQLKKGLDKIGLTIHHLSSKIDDGPMAWTKTTDNLPHYNYQLANQVLSQLCIEGVVFVLHLFINKLPIPEIPTNPNDTAYQKRPQLNNVLINRQTMSAIEICNLVRACNPWNKGALTWFQQQEVKLMDAQVISAIDSADNLQADTIINDDQSLHILCKDGKLINVNMLFLNDCFVPAYDARQWGLNKGIQFGLQDLTFKQ